ncbi:iron-sulfur cluster repair protein YtfE [Bradyrhizobium sp. UNPA324]|uniref:iron-sulfur cluster repair protein YtfE n=1 Tax=Bradyrhizobium sp. UNPA324 TaxID=1141174 RepID=UPI001150E279|nr:iron-sulfur cluster repair protein YtfE [Bradyrhizobium sp. UNPA324]TQF33756.1 regulator of cell morphogenesis and NO signaling [Bradyrhizobium sp. UNPA324]
MTTEASLRNRTVGEIAATLPGATAVFRRFKLDFCCGGDVLLAEAVRKRALDIAAVEEALDALDPRKSGSAPEATSALIDHILTRYHETHRRELPELARLARKVEAVHAGHPEVPQGLADTLEAIQAELEEHMQKEEAELFPLMQQQDAAGNQLPISQMRDDHDRHGELLRRLESLAKGFALPKGACRSWTALYGGTAKLVDDVMEHIHLENNVLFPRFERHGAA